MKILLRNYYGAQYTWVPAKYDGKVFIVDDDTITETGIVSIMNDNRKNYVLCSSCGQMFPRNGKKWQKHKEVSSSIEPCLHCRKCRTDEIESGKRKFLRRSDGTFTERYNRVVKLYCKYSIWSCFDIDSKEAVNTCPLRQCGSAHTKEIEDTFTKYPGIFDDMITVDKIFDNGYEKILFRDNRGTTIRINKELGLDVFINGLGIVEHFTIENGYDWACVWYSKKYGKLFCEDSNSRYMVWESNLGDEKTKEITDYIAKIYK